MALRHSLVRALNRHVLPHFQLALRKAREEGDHLPLPGRFRDRLIAETAALLDPFLRRLDPDAATADWIEDFLGRYAARPVRDNAGGTGFNGSLTLFAATRALAPDLIVESGTWKGHTAWLFAEAAPQARIITCDIEHANLEYRRPGIEYRLGDWTSHQLSADGARRPVLFLDDHVSHARRIAEAHARGFRTLLLDDDLPAQALFATGLPPATTAAMLSDTTITAGQEIAWTYRGRIERHRVSEQDLLVRRLIAERIAAPDLAPATWHARHNGISLLRLGDQPLG